MAVDAVCFDFEVTVLDFGAHETGFHFNLGVAVPVLEVEVSFDERKRPVPMGAAGSGFMQATESNIPVLDFKVAHPEDVFGHEVSVTAARGEFAVDLSDLHIAVG